MSKKVNIEKESEFNFFTSFDDVEETGLVFQFLDSPIEHVPSGDDKHNIPLEQIPKEIDMVEVPIKKEEVPKTYQKVIEVHEMNEAEKNFANRIRYILKLIFKGFFKENIVNAWCTGLSYGIITYDIIEQKYLPALIMFIYSLLYTDIKNGVKTLLDYCTSKKRRELEADLESHSVLNYTNSMIYSDEVKMYVKRKEYK